MRAESGVNRAQIDRLLAGIPADVDERRRVRIEAYAAIARHCREGESQRRVPNRKRRRGAQSLQFQ